MASLNHIHTYVRWQVGKGKDVTRGGDKMMRCIAQNCTHIAPMSLTRGKESLCTNCFSKIILDNETLRRIRPKCVKCSNTRESVKLRQAEEMVASILQEELKEIGVD